jgi:hypothetical protein
MKLILLLLFVTTISFGAFTPLPTGGAPLPAVSVSESVVGEIKEIHTFNGLIPIPSGWMIMNGDIVNETNYDAIHGAGAYVTDGVASSVLLSKNLPDMIGKYSVAVAATTQDGSGAITSVGNIANQSDISHTHAGASHNHLWNDYVASGSNTYNSGGSLVAYNSIGQTQSNGAGLFRAGGGDVTVGDAYTSNASGTTSSGGSATQSIQPESIEVIKIMKVI